MPRFGGEHPWTFHRTLHLQNNVESVFSSMKAWLDEVVARPQGEDQSVELLSMTICYSIAFALRPRHGGGSPRGWGRPRITAPGPPSTTAPAGSKNA